MFTFVRWEKERDRRKRLGDGRKLDRDRKKERPREIGWRKRSWKHREEEEETTALEETRKSDQVTT